MKSSLLLVALMSYMLSAGAATQLLATFNDPANDDNGAGTLSYPQRADFQSGDLDLTQLQVSRDEEGFWFEAKFKNPIRDPNKAQLTGGGEPLNNFARKGFYQFNIDIYVDTDRIKGSGNTFTLPGRHVGIDPEFAWEKAVILTPRPELMRDQLIDAMTEQYPTRSKAETEASIDQSMFLPTVIKVRGKAISFFVPASFFAGSGSGDWALTAFVTGALTTISADLSIFANTKKPIESLSLGVMQPQSGRPKETFGYKGPQPSPVVDLLNESAEQQVRQLTEKSALTGVIWKSHGANIEISKPVVTTSPAISEPSKAPEIAAPISQFLLPEVPVVVAPTRDTPVAVTPPQASQPQSNQQHSNQNTDQTIAKRLKTLQQLFDQKLIDEADYKQQKLRILNEL